MKELQKYALYKSLDWFKTNALCDNYGECYWRSSLERDFYKDLIALSTASNRPAKGIGTNHPGRLLEIQDIEIDSKSWGIIKIVTREEHPEYFV